MLKEDSTTTRLRVVFDASAETTIGLSPNDYLLVGPKLRDDLFNILLRFRFFKIALSVDVATDYRQVELDKVDRDFIGFFGNLQLMVRLKHYERPEFPMAYLPHRIIQSDICENVPICRKYPLRWKELY